MHSKQLRNPPLHTLTQPTANEHLEGMMEGELFQDEVVHLFRN